MNFLEKTLVYKCQIKHRYETFEAARRGMAQVVLHSVAIPGARMEVYKCKICGGFHFTSHGGGRPSILEIKGRLNNGKN